MTFFNIFSKEKEKEIRKKIIIDNREKNSLVPSELVKLGFQIEFTQLSIADYIINNIAIERKTINDLKSSIINKRIFSQLENLKQYPFYFLIIEGINDEDIYSGIIHENALRGFILSASLDYQVPIIFTQNERDTAKYLSILSNKSDKKDISIRAKKTFQTREGQIQFILEGFPNIGPVKAKALLKKFKSIKNIVNADEKELEHILGKRVKEFLALVHPP